VHAELTRLGHRCGRKRVARLMRSRELVGVHARRRWRRGRPDTAPAPDRVGRNFNPGGPDRLWAADVTQFRTDEGWLHLAAVIDLWSRRVVGWAMNNSVTAELVTDALVMAFDRRRPDRRVVHHSDQAPSTRASRSPNVSPTSSSTNPSVAPATATTTPRSNRSSRPSNENWPGSTPPAAGPPEPRSAPHCSTTSKASTTLNASNNDSGTAARSTTSKTQPHSDPCPPNRVNSSYAGAPRTRAQNGNR
jgi:hypothetical protein